MIVQWAIYHIFFHFTHVWLKTQHANGIEFLTTSYANGSFDVVRALGAKLSRNTQVEKVCSDEKKVEKEEVDHLFAMHLQTDGEKTCWWLSFYATHIRFCTPYFKSFSCWLVICLYLFFLQQRNQIMNIARQVCSNDCITTFPQEYMSFEWVAGWTKETKVQYKKCTRKSPSSTPWPFLWLDLKPINTHGERENVDLSHCLHILQETTNELP